MDLKEFVADSLAQIIEGIEDAQRRCAETGAWISPKGPKLPARSESPAMNAGGGDNQYLDDVKFDVAITASEGSSGGGEAKLQVLSVSLGGGGKVESQNSAVSRIQFSIPVVWPGKTNDERENLIRGAQERARNNQSAAVTRPPGGRASWMER